LTVDSGNQYFRFGQTSIKIRGTGEFKIENLTQADRTSFSGELDSRELEEIFSGSVLGSIWDAKYDDRPGIPDEAMIKLSLFEDGKKIAKLDLWAGVAEKSPQSEPVVQLLRKIVEKYTKGQFIL
ncbi:MAG: hypothetical protein ACFFD4_28905, partial [Candidatus Odinarchaeota archaeon]